MVIRVGEKLPIRVFFRDPDDNTLVNPDAATLTAELKRGDSTSTTKFDGSSMSSEETGIWFLNVEFDEEGTWTFQCRATSGVRIQIEQRQVVVHEAL